MQTLGPFTILFSDLPNDMDTFPVTTIPQGQAVFPSLFRVTTAWDDNGGLGFPAISLTLDLGQPDNQSIGSADVSPASLDTGVNLITTPQPAGIQPRKTKNPTLLSARYEANGAPSPATQGSLSLSILIQPTNNL